MPFDEDVEMPDAGPFLDLSCINSIPQDDSIRSPRTPTYIPSSLSFTTIQPFDPTALSSSSNFGLDLDLDLDLPPIPPTKPLRRKNQVPPPPATPPLSWVWQCHLCRSRWPIGATRRCLVDGHYYCSGETDQPNLKKKKKGQSCSSEFDYTGWREWGEWKRNALKAVGNTRVLKGCDKCEFPSQCRYSKAAEIESVSADIASTATKTSLTETPPTRKGNKGNTSRYYTNDSVSFEKLLDEAAANAGDASKEAKTYTLPVETSSKSNEDVKGRASKKGSSSRTKGKRAIKKGGLSPIEEEVPKVASLQDLVMPIVSFWNDKKINMKPSTEDSPRH